MTSEPISAATHSWLSILPVNTDLNWSDKKTALLTNRVDSIVERAIEELSK